MSEPPDLIRDALQLDIANRCRALRDRAEKSLHSEFASESPKSFLRLVVDIGETILEELLGRPRTVSDLGFIDSFVRDVASHVRYAEAASSARIPWSLSRPLESLAKAFLGEVTLLLRPQWRHNYSIVIDDISAVYARDLHWILGENQAEKTAKILSAFPKPFHIVSLPALERMNLLLHCDLAHEVGHLVAEKFFDESDRDDFSLDFRNWIFANSDSASLSKAERAQQVQEELDRAIGIRKRALEELIADVFAAYCFGPAYFLALLAMVIPRPLSELPSEESGFYPPSGMRLRLAVEVLRKRQLLPLAFPPEVAGTFEQLKPRIERSISEIEDFASTFPLLTETESLSTFDEEPLVRLAYSSVSTTLPRVIEFLDTKFADKFVQPEALFRESALLVNRLAEGLPPNEIGGAEGAATPARLESILNAAWLYRLGAVDSIELDLAAPRNQMPNLATVNRLALRAIELSRIHQEFRSWEESRGRNADT